MILQRYWRAKERHDAVAGELIDGPAIPLDHNRRAIDQLRHDLPQPLRTHRGGDIH